MIVGEPLVSVMMPCYNSARTLPWALASMLAQAYQNWECIVVDDGSDDDPGAVVEVANDPRFRLIRFPENRGRPHARQAALDAAQGEFLAMLDADDWVYPEKLAVQVAAMQAQPDLVLVSAGMLILDEYGNPAGVRCTGPGPGLTVFPPLRRLGGVPVAHGPTMIRLSLVKHVRYDTALSHSEDKDFLMQVVLGKPYGLLGEPLYVYTEHESVTEKKILRSMWCDHHIYSKYLRSHPVASRMQLASTLGKSVLYRAAFGLGLHERMIRHRSVTPGAHHVREFHVARNTVRDTVARRWPGSVPVSA